MKNFGLTKNLILLLAALVAIPLSAAHAACGTNYCSGKLRLLQLSEARSEVLLLLDGSELPSNCTPPTSGNYLTLPKDHVLFDQFYDVAKTSYLNNLGVTVWTAPADRCPITSIRWNDGQTSDDGTRGVLKGTIVKLESNWDRANYPIRVGMRADLANTATELCRTGFLYIEPKNEASTAQVSMLMSAFAADHTVELIVRQGRGATASALGRCEILHVRVTK